MTETTTPTPRTPATAVEPAVLSPQVVAAYEGMIAAIPDAGEAGADGILAAIAEASSIEDLDAPWRTDPLSAAVGRRIVITELRKRRSDYPLGLPWYLVVDGVDLDTGERMTLTTGSVTVVAQLVRAWALGSLPLVVIPRMADRPTAAGYYPMRLEIARDADGRPIEPPPSLARR